MPMVCSNHSFGWQEPLSDIVQTNGTNDRLVLHQDMRGERSLGLAWDWGDRIALIGRSHRFAPRHEGLSPQ
jgi:hypothetical protein